MKRIEQPNWFEDGWVQTVSGGERRAYVTQEQLTSWWKTQVEPVNKQISEGTVVYQLMHPDCSEGDWFQYPKQKHVTHTALLINIQPIKKETAEDLVRDIANGVYILEIDSDIRRRAKELLDE